MKKLNMLLASLGLLSSSFAMAQTELRFGVEAEYPPFESKNAQGQLEGFDIDLGHAICKAGNFKCSWVETSFDSLIPALKAKKFDAINSAMNITEKRKEAIDFTTPIYRIPTQLLGKPQAGLAPTAEALKGKNIGVLQGSIQEIYAKEHWEKQGVTVISYKDQNLAYDDLAAGRLDGTLVMAAAGQSGFLDRPEGKGFAFIGQPVDDATILGSGIGFGLRKDDAKLKEALDKAIKQVKEDGTVEKLAKQYFPGFDVRVE
ncbi:MULTISPECIES: transporter substrate-binding domain-containing protein [Brenneria]|uniref:ABC transporter substrate-binding protein n=1 Tax=Brenneria nigrifluens DSM 30175 = ATCC 13028 TaxID=1121120 RepID=A0A2U1UNJ8_9GAMM|nr:MULTISPECIES: transporter substrate-binding domain-containing protein [Brenneria]EHD20621.1 ABC-type transporter, periplasmic subunit family 3 [Brenneria sp. EniD312]PWC23207.1 ABC transporter substrate-binding protein [Brenneria nigrifluens DSM 30175 = ATCC 13028]QCR03806.1 ABC transporter substrate-binding protein [Brenneria nigrifluens DSM 30175 = ATCC 13028]